MAPKSKRQINGKANVAKAKHVIAKQVSCLALHARREHAPDLP